MHFELFAVWPLALVVTMLPAQYCRLVQLTSGDGHCLPFGEPSYGASQLADGEQDVEWKLGKTNSGGQSVAWR